MHDLLAVVGKAMSTITGMPMESIRPQTDLRNLKFAQLATLIMACEKHYHIAIADEWAVEFTCLQDLMDCIARELTDGRADYTAPTDEQRVDWYYE